MRKIKHQKSISHSVKTAHLVFISPFWSSTTGYKLNIRTQFITLKKNPNNLWSIVIVIVLSPSESICKWLKGMTSSYALRPSLFYENRQILCTCSCSGSNNDDFHLPFLCPSSKLSLLVWSTHNNVPWSLYCISFDFHPQNGLLGFSEILSPLNLITALPSPTLKPVVLLSSSWPLVSRTSSYWSTREAGGCRWTAES